ncbi:hypothetical protein GC163_05670 [bacterium]|nr:hypothetical protein [bacterium]
MRARDAICWLSLVFVGSASAAVFAADDSAPDVAPTTFELRDGDRVVLLGGTFIEREGQYGYIETALTAAYPYQQITFRNLGWSGDTVWAESRGVFDPPAVGYQRMVDLVTELKPTVIILAYGQNEAFAGDAGLEKFRQQYRKLCDDLSPTQARLVFVTPYLFEKADPPLPDASRWNPALQSYAQAIRELAAERHGSVVDLTAALADVTGRTENGIHLTSQGYQRAALAFSDAVGVSQPVPGTGELQQKIVEKNTLFFHRWRPQNITYLFLFRKHEQGNNAVDIPMFDELTAEADQEIAKLRQSLP